MTRCSPCGDVVITVYLADECGALHAGPYTGDAFAGSFVTYICDRKRGHRYPRGHMDSTCGFMWSDAPAPTPDLVLVGSDPAGSAPR